MALVRKFAFNMLRAATQLSDSPNLPVKPCRRPTKPPRPKKPEAPKKNRLGMSTGSPKSSTAKLDKSK
jgi:hypothetical protein